MIKRATLIALRAAAIADDSTTIVRSSVLLALLDVAEAVQDAPRALLTTDSESCDGEEIVELSPFTIQDEKAIEAMHRKRVRLVRDGGE